VAEQRPSALQEDGGRESAYDRGVVPRNRVDIRGVKKSGLHLPRCGGVKNTTGTFLRIRIVKFGIPAKVSILAESIIGECHYYVPD